VTAVSEHLDSTAWWDAIQNLVDTPLRDLIDGLDEVAAHAIPYGWLPRRARTFYSAQYATWSDLAGETITSLFDRSNCGVGTVRAIVIAAREAVATARSTSADDPGDAAAAIRRVLNRLTEYDYTVLSARGWALHPQTIPATARQLGVAPVNVRRHQPRSHARLRDLLADPAHAAVGDYAKHLRHRLGPLTREHIAQQELHDMGLDLATDAGQMLLHLAGPYSWKDTWLEDTAAQGLATAGAALDAAFDQHGAPTNAILTTELDHLGIPALTAIEFIDSRAGLRRFGDKWVRWGSSIVDKTEAALHLSSAPATPALLAATINDGITERSVREALWDDPRFTRATRQTWALRNWGIAEYTGVFAEIAARVDTAGCRASASAATPPPSRSPARTTRRSTSTSVAASPRH
jgi:hypothetical protein